MTGEALVATILPILGESGAPWEGALRIVSSMELFRAWIDQFGGWAPAIFFLAQALQVIVAPIPGSVFPPAGAVAFGPEAALGLTTGGTLAGSFIVFVLARRWGRPLVSRLVGKDTFERYAEIVAKGNGLCLCVILLMPIVPEDAVCALAGTSSLSLRRFLIASTLGRLPGTVLSVYLVDHAVEGLLSAWIIALVALVAVIGALLTVKYRARLEPWLVRHASSAA